MQLAASVLCVVLVASVGWLVERNDFVTQTSRESQTGVNVVTSIPDCREDVFLSKNCLAFLYAPAGDPAVEVLGLRS